VSTYLKISLHRKKKFTSPLVVIVVVVVIVIVVVVVVVVVNKRRYSFEINDFSHRRRSTRYNLSNIHLGRLLLTSQLILAHTAATAS